jgi:hypothetical protein
MVIVQHRIEGAANAERHPAFRCASAMEGDRIWLQLRGDIILEHLHTPSHPMAFIDVPVSTHV